MSAEIQKIDDASIEHASALLLSGELVAFPTETVYGLGANALNPVAVEKIFAAKGRPADNPLIVHIADPDDAERFAYINENAKAATRFWPGPLTLVMERKPSVSDAVTAGLNSVAVRMPAHEDALRLIRAAGVPIAAPSANRSGGVSPTSAQMVYDDLKDEIALILDGGECAVGLESTVLDVRGEVPVILRPGAVTLEMLEQVFPRVLVHEGVLEAHGGGEAASPGMKHRHYAPKAPVYISDGPNAREKAERASAALKANGYKCEVLCFEDDSEAAARQLYARLREADASGADAILIEAVDMSGLGLAVMNRALRAAEFRRLYSKTILFVCTGNTCRSPMAQGLMERLLAVPHMLEYCAASRGMYAPDGAPASANAQQVAAERGIDISGHKAQNLDLSEIDSAHAVLVMTQEHKLALPEHSNVMTLAEAVGEYRDVPDPYGGSAEDYRRTISALADLTEKLLALISVGKK